MLGFYTDCEIYFIKNKAKIVYEDISMTFIKNCNPSYKQSTSQDSKKILLRNEINKKRL